MTDINKALLDPTSVYKLPKEVLVDDTLTQEQKIEVLHQWEYDIRELQVAAEENMPESPSDGEETGDLLTQVLDALRELGAGAKDS